MKPLMILGTSSHAGKTTLVAGLCRLFANRGLKVTPFKSQNMSLNSFATIHGEEIARSIAVQAFAARQVPTVHMNPILLKPKNDQESQVIIHGKSVGDAMAKEYCFSPAWHERKTQAVHTSIDALRTSFDLIIAEGAGSCAEPNFIANDLVNMGMARLLDADVYLVVDIDKGGAFADVLGTLRVFELLAPEHKNRIKGILINKFRGDEDLLKEPIEFISQHTGITNIAVIPYLFDLDLEEEDRVKPYACKNPEIDIAVAYLPHISNTSDFTPLSAEQNVQLRFVRSPESLGAPDLLILPGTKSTLSDLDFMRRTGWEEAIRALVPNTPLMGICGGFEMLGKTLHDLHQVESNFSSMPGFGFFDFTVRFNKTKKVSQVYYQPTEANPFRDAGPISGYEIHCGEVEYGQDNCPVFISEHGVDGAFLEKPFIFGTFIHDLFKNSRFTRSLINELRKRKRLPPLISPLIATESRADKQCDRLAEVLEGCLGSLIAGEDYSKIRSQTA